MKPIRQPLNEIELCDALVTAHEVDVLVNLVRQNHHLRVFGDDLGDGAEFVLRIDHAGRVRRAAEHHQLGFRRDGRFQLLGRDFEVVLDFAGDIFDVGLRHLRDGAVGNPVRRGDNHLVAGVYQSHNSLIDGLFAASGNHNLLRCVIQPIVSLELIADGFQQISITGHRRIMGEVVVNSLLGIFLHCLGRVEIGFADTQTDDILTFFL